jgi:hypothetical protein
MGQRTEREQQVKQHREHEAATHGFTPHFFTIVLRDGSSRIPGAIAVV